MNKPLAVEKVLWYRRGKGIGTCGRIPEEAEFFKDHFPGFPVLPGVLALEMLKQSAECYLSRTEDPEKRRRFSLKTVRQVKFSQYLKPGESWESSLELVSEADSASTWVGRLMCNGKLAVSARLEMASEAAAEKNDALRHG